MSSPGRCLGLGIWILLASVHRTFAWVPTEMLTTRTPPRGDPIDAQRSQRQNHLSRSLVTPTYHVASILKSTFNEASDANLLSLPELTTDELEQILSLHDSSASDNNDDQLITSVREALPTLPPRLMVKLRQLDTHPNPKVSLVAQALQSILTQQLQQGAELLKDLLNAGEIRQLDSLIGKAGREKRLDPAFFQVLSFNLQDAAAAAEQRGEPDQEVTEGDDAGMASRYQILKHIYTRCQEEVEKTIPPGVALLNKLLRTEQPSIRSNLIQHYLTPTSTVIKSPDGKEINLASSPNGSNNAKALVPLPEFVQAVSEFVQQIRTVEAAGGTDQGSAAAMVEACRQVAKEVRLVFVEQYGAQSAELMELQDGLQPVFRPTSTSSPYIQRKA